MKRIAAITLSLMISAGITTARAQAPGDEFVGTWKSPQMVDTTIEIQRTETGYIVQERQQNVFGGAQVMSRTADLIRPGMLHVGGTSVYEYDKATGIMVLTFGPSTAASFVRQPQ